MQRYPQTAPGVVRALRTLAACRTAALGGHATRCTHCGVVTYHYHSCGNRHCPSCGGSKRAAWLEKRRAELLPVPYFHLVFTLPHELSALALGNRPVLKYLTAYTHRVALSNRRLVALSDSHVTLTYKDYADGCRRKELTLEALEFVRRFAMHIVPKGFVRVRHYGLLAHRDRGVRLAKCRALLAANNPDTAVAPAVASPAPVPRSSAAACSPRPGITAVLALPLLLGVLATPAAIATAPVAAAAPAPPTPVHGVAAERCPGCGQGRLITVWHAGRPTSRQLEQCWRWNTS